MRGAFCVLGQKLLRSTTSPSSLRDATARVAAPSVCFAAARILLAAAPRAKSPAGRRRANSPRWRTPRPMSWIPPSLRRICSKPSQSRRRRDSSPGRGASGETVHFAGTAKASPTRSNGDDRRQWRKQGVVVGAAASKTQAKRCGCWVPQPGLVCECETERLDEG